MNFSTLLGFLAAISVCIFAVADGGKTSWGLFLNSHALLVVVGGSMAASMLSFPLPKMINLVRVVFKRIIGKTRVDYKQILAEITTLSNAALRSKGDFERVIPSLKNAFLKDAAEILFWKEANVTADKLRYLLEIRAETHFERYTAEAQTFKIMSKFPPSFGLMGTTLGMINLLRSLGQSNSQSMIGPSMSVALVATLYGIVVSNFVLIPIAENLLKQTEEDLTTRKMIIEAIMAIEESMPTSFVEEAAKSFLLPSERAKASESRSNRNEQRRAA